MLCRWIKKYLEQGEESLENKRKPGNPLVKYCNKKNLSDMEKLEYENMKLRIENERLKKRLHDERRCFICNVQKIKEFEFEIVEKLSKEFNVKSLYIYMKISRSGYYKWLKNKNILNQYEINRLNMQIKLWEIGKQRDHLKKLYQLQQHFDLRKNVMIGHII